jgi:2-polyprenyl-3-methyl-5-hydroxy-6-metoxy-1,4-benzoquinol methylase
MSKEKLDYCDLCGSRDHEFVFTNNDRMFPDIKGEYKLYECKTCGLSFLNQPSPEVLEKHYSAGYSVYSDSEGTNHSRKIFTLIETLYHYIQLNKDISGFSRVLKFLFSPLSNYFRTVKVIEKGKYLDVGCGIGYFPLVMKYLGMEPHGVEPAAFDQELSKYYSLNILNSTLEDAKYENDYFDVISLNHVLEHVPNPSVTIEELYRILKPGGYLIIAVPLKDSLASKIFGKFWAQLDTPRHLHLFSTEILKQYARKYNFDIMKIRYNSEPRYQIIGSLMYFWESFSGKKSNRMLVHNLYLNLMLIPFTSMLNLLKLGDQCEIILKKPNSE